MNVDTDQPWQHMSTPEDQAEHDLRDEFEAALEQLYDAAERLDGLRERWWKWRDASRS